MKDNTQEGFISLYILFFVLIAVAAIVFFTTLEKQNSIQNENIETLQSIELRISKLEQLHFQLDTNTLKN